MSPSNIFPPTYKPQRHPHLLPNARLEAYGPTAGSSNSSVTIHNLQRVEAGLRGEWLAPTLDLEEGNVTVTEGMDDGTNKGQKVSEGEGEGWMDLDEYQREQSIEGGEIGQGEPGVVQEGDSDFEEPDRHEVGEDEDGVEREAQVKAPKAKKLKTKHENVQSGKISTKPIDKEARRREKKQRHKEEQKQKQKQKQAEITKKSKKDEE